MPLTERQINYFIKKYFSFVDKDLLQMVVNEKDEMVGFMLAMPSLSSAFQKANGRLVPPGLVALAARLEKERRPGFLPGRHLEETTAARASTC